MMDLFFKFLCGCLTLVPPGVIPGSLCSPHHPRLTLPWVWGGVLFECKVLGGRPSISRAPFAGASVSLLG